MKLGKLERVNLREIWEHEAFDFTNWLSKDENISLLSEELGINMSVVETEQKIGSFNVDILCEEEETEDKIIIENQLERTNHDHLGKIITYASGVDAKYILWIVADIRDEHKSAIEWLNRMTRDEVNFFLIKIETWKIGDSSPAPKFNIVVEPNAWNRAVKSVNIDKDITGAKLKRVEFWTTINDAIEKYSKVFNTRKASTDHWYDLPIGTSRAHISFELLQLKKQIRLNIYIPHDQELYNKFFENKEKIEEQLGYELIWDESPGTKKSQIFKLYKNIKLDSEEYIENLTKQLVLDAEKFREVFSKYI